ETRLRAALAALRQESEFERNNSGQGVRLSFCGDAFVSTAVPETTDLRVGDRVRIAGRYAHGVGEVLRVQQTGGLVIADVVFDGQGGRRLETLPVSRLEKASSPWDRLRVGHYDDPR